MKESDNFEMHGFGKICDNQGKNNSERQAATQEPAPTGNGQYVLIEVIKDLCARADEGQKKYGTMLRTENGRNALNDLYQELADALMYLKQYMLEEG